MLEMKGKKLICALNIFAYSVKACVNDVWDFCIYVMPLEFKHLNTSVKRYDEYIN